MPMVMRVTRRNGAQNGAARNAIESRIRSHPIIPLITISQRDGLTDYRCLTCLRPASFRASGTPRVRRWTHYIRSARWKPRIEVLIG